MKTSLTLCSGVGGSKLPDVLARMLPPEHLSIVVNTADDFDHLGLRMDPDIDTMASACDEFLFNKADKEAVGMTIRTRATISR